MSIFQKVGLVLTWPIWGPIKWGWDLAAEGGELYPAYHFRNQLENAYRDLMVDPDTGKTHKQLHHENNKAIQGTMTERARLRVKPRAGSLIEDSIKRFSTDPWRPKFISGRTGEYLSEWVDVGRSMGARSVTAGARISQEVLDKVMDPLEWVTIPEGPGITPPGIKRSYRYLQGQSLKTLQAVWGET